MANSAIRMMCPNLRCRSLLAVPASARGKNVRCKQCGSRITVPDKAAGSPAPPAPTPQTTEAEK